MLPDCHIFKFPATCDKDMADERTREAGSTLSLLIEGLVLVAISSKNVHLYLGKESGRMRNNKMAAVRIFFSGCSFMAITTEPL
jgi:hypothetical protein